MVYDAKKVVCQRHHPLRAKSHKLSTMRKGKKGNTLHPSHQQLPHFRIINSTVCVMMILCVLLPLLCFFSYFFFPFFFLFHKRRRCASTLFKRPQHYSEGIGYTIVVISAVGQWGNPFASRQRLAAERRFQLYPGRPLEFDTQTWDRAKI